MKLELQAEFLPRPVFPLKYKSQQDAGEHHKHLTKLFSDTLDYLDPQASLIAKYLYILSYLVLLKKGLLWFSVFL